MATDRLQSNDLLQTDSQELNGYSLESSRLLLGLMTFASDKSQMDDPESTNALGGVISPGVLRSLLSALHYRDVATVKHSRRVAMLAVGMAHYLGWERPEQKVLEIAALMHDIGKIGVPDNILFKPGKLNPDESELMSLHQNIGVDVLQACRVEHQVLEIISQSRGTDGIFDDQAGGFRRANTSMHQGARILSVADAYDSLATDQVYRKGRPHQEIMTILRESAGTQFDGSVVSALAHWIESDGLPFTKGQEDVLSPSGPRDSVEAEEALEGNFLGNMFSYLYLLESLYDGFYLVDSDLRFVVWSQNCETLFGSPATEMLGQAWTSRLVGFADKSGNHLVEGDSPLNRVIAEGKATTSNEYIVRPNGKKLEVELQSVPLLDQNGRLQGVAEIFRNLSRTSHQPQEYRELKLAATRDPLTSVANRRELESQLAALFKKYIEDDQPEPFSVIFLDIDFFKNINDTLGHSVGDEVLIDFAQLLQQESYSGELIGRYGGEEFILLCPSTSLENAVSRAERIRAAIPRAESGRLGDYNVTASFGVAQVEPEDSVESILKRVDKALYNAKETGRNRTCSLTAAQFNTVPTAGDESSENHHDPFTYTTTFYACIAADLIVYKLGGFVRDHKAKLLEVNKNHARIHLGRRGILPYWGRTDERRPIELTLKFSEEDWKSTQGPQAASKQVAIEVQVHPLGRINDDEVFQGRARRVVKELRSYFAST